MIESPFYEVIKDEGRLEGIAEGQALALRDSVLEFLGALSPDVSERVKTRVTAEHDLGKLREWMRLSRQVSTLADFEARM